MSPSKGRHKSLHVDLWNPQNETGLWHCCSQVSSGPKHKTFRFSWQVSILPEIGILGNMIVSLFSTFSPLCPYGSETRLLSSLFPQAPWALPPTCLSQDVPEAEGHWAFPRGDYPVSSPSFSDHITKKSHLALQPLYITFFTSPL